MVGSPKQKTEFKLQQQTEKFLQTLTDMLKMENMFTLATSQYSLNGLHTPILLNLMATHQTQAFQLETFLLTSKTLNMTRLSAQLHSEKQLQPDIHSLVGLKKRTEQTKLYTPTKTLPQKTRALLHSLLIGLQTQEQNLQSNISCKTFLKTEKHCLKPIHLLKPKNVKVSLLLLLTQNLFLNISKTVHS